MSKDMYCNHCGAYVGECGHEPGVTDPVTLSGTCQCGREFSVTCNGNCLGKKDGREMNEKLGMCDGTGVIVVNVKYECGACDGSGKVLDQTCSTCRGTGKMTVAEQRDCPGCVNCRKTKTTTVWECSCAKCGFSWTDSDDNTTCPECGSDEGMCAETEISSNPIMPSD